MAQEKIRVAGGRKPRKSKLTPDEKAEKRAAAKAKLAEDIEKGIVVDPAQESY